MEARRRRFDAALNERQRRVLGLLLSHDMIGQHLGLRNARTPNIPNCGVDEAFAGALEQVQEDVAAAVERG